MSDVRLFEEDELEAMIQVFAKICREKGYEGIIAIADRDGTMRTHRENPELGFIDVPSLLRS